MMNYGPMGVCCALLRYIRFGGVLDDSDLPPFFSDQRRREAAEGEGVRRVS